MNLHLPKKKDAPGDTNLNPENAVETDGASAEVTPQETVGVGTKIKRWWHGTRVKFANWMGPKLDRLRTDKNEELPELFVPSDLADLVWFLKRVPEEVLSTKERKMLVLAMTFSEARVRDLMLPREKITFIYENDFMGPLTLDRLYKSGFSHFPVLGSRSDVIVGVIHTRALTSLEIKETDRASSFLDPKVYFIRDNYTLLQALTAFLRTNCQLAMVVNTNGQLVGMLTFKTLVSHLIGEVPEDEFREDADVMAVAKRK